jgi:hypothetical protein
MVKIRKTECDRCGKQGDDDLDGWDDLPNGWDNTKDMDLCPECLKRYEKILEQFKQEEL